MPHFHYRRRLPYPREKVFDLVADVERYPEFLPGWREVRILRREAGELLVEQQLGLRGFTFRFRTTALLERPEQIHIRTRERPFRYLEQYWRFQPADGDWTLASLEADYTLRDLPFRFMLTGLFDWGFRQTLLAFQERASDILG